ncbi:TIR domain-containing protein [bacterium]|nr:MAG: TIR domain-containing protein [bacterium]
MGLGFKLFGGAKKHVRRSNMDSFDKETLSQHLKELWNLLCIVPIVWLIASIGFTLFIGGTWSQRILAGPAYGLFLAYPVLCIQVWRFARPGLYVKEKILLLFIMVAIPFIIFLLGLFFSPIERLLVSLLGQSLPVGYNTLISKVLLISLTFALIIGFLLVPKGTEILPGFKAGELRPSFGSWIFMALVFVLPAIISWIILIYLGLFFSALSIKYICMKPKKREDTIERIAREELNLSGVDMSAVITLPGTSKEDELKITFAGHGKLKEGLAVREDFIYREEKLKVADASLNRQAGGVSLDTNFMLLKLDPGMIRTFEQKVVIYEDVWGSDLLEAATELLNLGERLYEKGDDEAGKFLLDKALKIRGKVLGSEHPDTIYIHNLLFKAAEADIDEIRRSLRSLKDDGGTDSMSLKIYTPRSLQHQTIIQEISFSAFYPEKLGPRDIGKIICYGHLESVAEEVARDAARRLELPSDIKIRASSEKTSRPVVKESSIKVTPDVPGLDFEKGEDTMSLWEDFQSIEFRFRPHSDCIGKACHGWIHFWLEGLMLADVAITIFIAEEEIPEIFREALAKANARPYRRVFPSYSHVDSEVVERMAVYAASFGDEYFQDVHRLRSGQRWNDELIGFIKQADVFQLFWSENAIGSKYVEQEWKCAVGERSRRPDSYFLRPVYWTEKPAVPIPTELQEIHFARISHRVLRSSGEYN